MLSCRSVSATFNRINVLGEEILDWFHRRLSPSHFVTRRSHGVPFQSRSHLGAGRPEAS
jgi:hypothetical protein